MNKIQEAIYDELIFSEVDFGSVKYLSTDISKEVIKQLPSLIEYIGDNYYYNSSCWNHCETDEVHSKEEIINNWLNE